MRLAIAIAVMAAACGCAPPPAVSAPPPPRSAPGFPRTIAIAPFANWTASVDGPDVLRVRVRRVLVADGYDVQRLGDTDQRLRGIGISLGGQIPNAKWQELGSVLGTDAVITGDVIKYQSVVTGLHNLRDVEAHVAMVDLRTGHVLWHEHQKFKNHEDAVEQSADVAGDDGRGCVLFPVFCVGDLVYGAAEHRMVHECEALAALLTASLPPPGVEAPSARPPSWAEPAPEVAQGTAPAPMRWVPGDAVWAK